MTQKDIIKKHKINPFAICKCNCCQEKIPLLSGHCLKNPLSGCISGFYCKKCFNETVVVCANCGQYIEKCFDIFYRWESDIVCLSCYCIFQNEKVAELKVVTSEEKKEIQKVPKGTYDYKVQFTELRGTDYIFATSINEKPNFYIAEQEYLEENDIPVLSSLSENRGIDVFTFIQKNKLKPNGRLFR